MAFFLLLIFVATWMLRRQMHSVARAEAAWRTEVAWRSAMEDSMVVGLRARDFDGRLVYVNRTQTAKAAIVFGKIVIACGEAGRRDCQWQATMI